MTLGVRERDHALASLERRRAGAPPPLDNAAMPAGAPMVFYCRDCGWLADLKPEEYIFSVRELCSECEGLHRHGVTVPPR